MMRSKRALCAVAACMIALSMGFAEEGAPEITAAPTAEVVSPTAAPTEAPIAEPTTTPTVEPTVEPTTEATAAPTERIFAARPPGKSAIPPMSCGGVKTPPYSTA